MKACSYLVSFTMAICGLVVIELSASAAAANITGTWEVTDSLSAAGSRPRGHVRPEAGRREGHRHLPRHVRSR